MNNTATATAKETVRRPAPAAPSSAGRMTRRVGNTTYRVTLHFKENGKEDMLTRYARERNFPNVSVYSDDGWSGTNFAGVRYRNHFCMVRYLPQLFAYTA